MRGSLLLAISVALVTAARAQNPVTIELPGRTLTAKDGFRARIYGHAFTQKDPAGRQYSGCTFDIYVPRRVGKTTLGYPSLQIAGRDDRCLVEVAMRNYPEEGEGPHFYVFVERRTLLIVSCTLPTTDGHGMRLMEIMSSASSITAI